MLKNAFPNFRFIFRSASDHDIPKIIELVQKVLVELDLKFSPETSESDLFTLEATYDNNGGAFEIIENDESEIIGMIALLKLSDSQSKLRKLYVDKKYRKLGLGRQLIDGIIEKAIHLGFKEVILETVHSMVSAIHLYESYGFQTVDDMVANSPRCDIVMRLELS